MSASDAHSSINRQVGQFKSDTIAAVKSRHLTLLFLFLTLLAVSRPLNGLLGFKALDRLGNLALISGIYDPVIALSAYEREPASGRVFACETARGEWRTVKWTAESRKRIKGPHAFSVLFPKLLKPRRTSEFRNRQSLRFLEWNICDPEGVLREILDCGERPRRGRVTIYGKNPGEIVDAWEAVCR